MRFYSLFFVGMGLAVLGPLMPSGRAQSSDDSPFLPPNSANGGAGSKADAGLELRGIMSTNEGLRYCIYDSTTKTSKWVAANESGQPFVVQDFDKGHDTVTVTHDGRRLTLALREAKVGSGGGRLNGQPAPPIGMPVVLRPTPEDEQRRLQAIAEEVRRRRLLREQAQQGGVPNGSRPQ